MRPIDADALVEMLREQAEHKWFGSVEARMHLCDQVRFAIDCISEAPTLDVQPVRRGEWRYVNYQTDKTTWITGEFICRKCGKSTPRHMGDNPPDYCQHCGADMRKVRTDDV